MTQINITMDLDQIQTLIERSGANDTAKDIFRILFNQVMEKERTEYIQAENYERHEERKTQRNGYYDRDFITRIGSLNLRVPRTRDGVFSPSLFEKYQRHEKALITTMMEMVICGVSTRNVTKAVEELCGETVSKSFVSSIIKQLDPIVEEWRNRSLKDKTYTFLMVDDTNDLETNHIRF
mgnify:FL=1